MNSPSHGIPFGHREHSVAIHNSWIAASAAALGNDRRDMDLFYRIIGFFFVKKFTHPVWR